MEDIKPDTIILDPPRQGSDRQTLAEICGLSPNKIVMWVINMNLKCRLFI
ncbi:MAG TPA: hypothetical protein GX520_04495 [Syntrophaceticus sp.]|jgi:tRNA/tmRNA/rRNA uracil-C5-methylase (TrmA/RlmC/RlmD family)|uniref:Uncharacterized protein n=1 Tax=Syntrophaceticus schinkii TaxID=499207 RepID=A0A0B7MDH1_9FIRM|nr:hypothetical protein [Syntrophaceticus schinkii]CEO88624.1 hypothetical protein SSCH_220032 [Syntrophaceticus schinkii]HHY29938.1 hypothetical protein [Syntrophaceticus sp.]